MGSKFSNGYYLGRKGGFWTETGHNQAKEERVYIGKVVHYYPKVGIAEILLEAGDIEKDQNIIITGKTTGLLRETVESLRDADENEATEVKRGEVITIPTSVRVRENDRVYKLVDRKNFR